MSKGKPIHAKEGQTERHSDSIADDAANQKLDAEIARCELTWGKGSSSAPFTPVVGIDIHPIIIIRDSRGKVFDDDEHNNSENPIARTVGIRYRWLRGPSRNVCCYHPFRPATTQCTETQTCFCSSECFMRFSQLARECRFANMALPAPPSNLATATCIARPYESSTYIAPPEDAVLARLAARHNARDCAFDASHFLAQMSFSSGSSAVISERGTLGPGWEVVGTGREFVPRASDVGHVFLFEAELYAIASASLVGSSADAREAANAAEVSPCSLGAGHRHVRVRTACVIPQRALPAMPPLSYFVGTLPPDMLTVAGVPRALSHLLQQAHASREPLQPLRALPEPTRTPCASLCTPGRFRVMSWNVLADIYATTEAFPHCEAYVLSWAFRRARLLEEIIAANADVVCLQEVQAEHYDEFFLPELAKWGYVGVYKAKTSEIFTTGTGKRRAGKMTIDGCATFFRSDRFAASQTVAVEFFKHMREWAPLATLSAEGANGQAEIKRLLKDNVALIVVLKDLSIAPSVVDGPQADPTGRYIVVVNTHIAANPEHTDVKLLQCHVLLNAIARVADDTRRALQHASDTIPVPNAAPADQRLALVVVGDFNSPPSSAVYSLLAAGSVHLAHPDLRNPQRRLMQTLKDAVSSGLLDHALPLRSAYAVASAAMLRSVSRAALAGAASLASVATVQPSAPKTAFANFAGDSLSDMMLNCPGPTAAMVSAAHEPTFTNYTGSFTGCLDYLWFAEDTLQVCAVRETPTEESLRAEQREFYLASHSPPSIVRPSDHLALLAEFSWLLPASVAAASNETLRQWHETGVNVNHNDAFAYRR